MTIQSPEASQGQVSRAGDWWAVGMIIAHAALGHHPLALPDGRLPSDQVILTHLAQRDIDLTGITDPRLRLLCQGLLTRDADKRWTIDQIRAWRAGQSPTTGYGTTNRTPATTTVGGVSGRVRSVRFAGTEHTTPAALAAAFAADPVRAGTQLFAERDPTLVEDLRLMLRAAGLHEADALLSGHKSGPWEQTFLRLLVEMDPTLSPTLAGQDMTPTGIGTLAQHVINTNTATPQQQCALTWITDHRLWHWWRTLPGMDDATEAAERLTTLGDPNAVLRDAGLTKPDGHWRHLIVTATRKVTWQTAAPGILEGRVLLDPETVGRYWQESAPKLAAWRVLLATVPSQTTPALAQHLRNNAPKLPHQTWWTALTHGDQTLQLPIAAVLTGLAHTAENTYTPATTAFTKGRELEQLRQQLSAIPLPDRAIALRRFFFILLLSPFIYIPSYLLLVVATIPPDVAVWLAIVPVIYFLIRPFTQNQTNKVRRAEIQRKINGVT